MTMPSDPRSPLRPHFSLRDEVVTLNHGSGGKASHALVENVFVKALANPLLNPLADQALLEVGAGRLAFTTDSYVVDPIFFPGGDIGRLAVNGTVNDLAVAGARPLYLSLGVILEEGFPIADLRRIVASIAEAAAAAGVVVTTGDTKVVPRGKADRIFLNTSGIGLLRRPPLDPNGIRPGDRILISGSVGDHGLTILVARGDLGLELETTSDTAPLHELAAALLEAAPDTRCLKDPTRGGLATTLNEIALQSGWAFLVNEEAVPVAPEVRGACELMGIDPFYVANEGKLLAVVPAASAPAALAALQAHPLGTGAREIGEVAAEPERLVLLRTAIGGTRVLDMLTGDPLPRIC
jgi:hydrogenase expression/formation protein HypE